MAAESAAAGAPGRLLPHGSRQLAWNAGSFQFQPGSEANGELDQLRAGAVDRSVHLRPVLARRADGAGRRRARVGHALLGAHQAAFPNGAPAGQVAGGDCMLWIFSVALPAAAGALAARFFFGNVDFAVVAFVASGQILSVALVVLLVLAASTVVTSRALAVGIGLALMLAPHYLRPIAGVPPGQPFMEAWPSSIAGWVYAVGHRMPASSWTPIGYLAGMIILAVLAKLRFDAEELR